VTLMPSTATDRLVELAQELLDAHSDTVYLADELPGGDGWAAHVDYLRALQRTAKRELATLAGGAPFGASGRPAATGAP
jgi:hypothetical protein